MEKMAVSKIDAVPTVENGWQKRLRSVLKAITIVLSVLIAIPLTIGMLLFLLVSANSYYFDQNLKVSITLENREGNQERFSSVIKVTSWRRYFIPSMQGGTKEAYTDDPVVVPLPGNRSIAFAYEDMEPGSLPSKWIIALALREYNRKCGIVETGYRIPAHCRGSGVPLVSWETMSRFMNPKNEYLLPHNLYPTILYFSDNSDEKSAVVISSESVSDQTNGQYRLIAVTIQPTRESVTNNIAKIYSWHSGQVPKISMIARRALY